MLLALQPLAAFDGQHRQRVLIGIHSACAALRGPVERALVLLIGDSGLLHRLSMLFFDVVTILMDLRRLVLVPAFVFISHCIFAVS